MINIYLIVSILITTKLSMFIADIRSNKEDDMVIMYFKYGFIFYLILFVIWFSFL